MERLGAPGCVLPDAGMRAGPKDARCCIARSGLFQINKPATPVYRMGGDRSIQWNAADSREDWGLCSTLLCSSIRRGHDERSRRSRRRGRS